MYFLPSASFLSSYYWDQQPTRLPHPWYSPGKNTGVGCHFHLQCIKVKNESEVAQSCPTLSDPMDCSLPGSPVHGISQMRILEWVAIFFLQGISLPNSGIKPETSALQMDSLPLSHQGKIDTLYQEFHNRESNTKILSKSLVAHCEAFPESCVTSCKPFWPCWWCIDAFLTPRHGAI